jgi:cell division protein FtsI/penicillin-binding protein 2
MTKKQIFSIAGIIILVLVVVAIYKIETYSTDDRAQPESSLKTANQITMKVIMVDENANAEYATVWLTPSARIYTLAKNITDYKIYIDLMEKSKKDGSLLTFTLATDDPSVIKSINK